MSKKTYFATVDGMINGAHHKANDELQLTDREAKYLVMAGLVSKTKKWPARTSSTPRSSLSRT